MANIFGLERNIRGTGKRCLVIACLMAVFCVIGPGPQGSAAGPSAKEEDAFYVGAKAYEDGFYDVSLDLFDKFLKTYPDSDKKYEALVYVGQNYYFQEKYLKALDQLEALLKTPGAEPVKDKVLFWLGRIHAKGRDYRQAAEYFKQLVQDFPKSFYFAQAYQSLAQIQLTEGRFAEALATYRAILSQVKDPAAREEATVGMCECLYRMKDYGQLKNELKVFIEQHAGASVLSRAYFYLGEAHFYLDEFPEAADAYRRSEAAASGEEERRLAQTGLGWSFIKMKKFDAAEEIFSKFVMDDPPASVLLGRAVVRAGLEDHEGALQLYDRVLAVDKGSEYKPLAFFGRAEALYNLSRFDEAIVAYRVSLDSLKAFSGLYTQSRELRDKIHYGLAWSYLKVGDFPSAQEMFQKVVTLSSDKIVKLSALCQLGDTYQDAGDYPKAVETYQNFLRDYPQSAYDDYVQYQLGMAWLRMENFDSAVLALRKLLKDYAGSKLVDDASYFIAAAYFQKGDFSSARSQLEQFVKEFRDSSYRPQALFLLGEVHLNMKDHKAALETFGAVVREYPQQESLRQKAEYETANVYAQMGNEAESNKRLTDFITRYPDSQLSADILFWLGQSYLEKGDPDMAQKYLERLIRNYPEHELIAEAYLDIGVSQLKQDRDDAALRDFEKAAELGRGPVRAKALSMAADVYTSREDWENALRLYGQVVDAAGPLSKSALVKMAQIQRRKKAFEEALVSLQKALELEGAQPNAAILMEIAELQEELGREQEAVQNYLKATYLYPDDGPMAVKALLRVARIYESRENWKDLEVVLKKIMEYEVPEAKYAKEKLQWLESAKSRR